MPRFVFLGGPECGDVDSVVMFGVTLPLGVPVEVTEAHAVRKLRGNMFFREVEAEAPVAGVSIPCGVELAEPYSDNPPQPVKRRGRPPRV